MKVALLDLNHITRGVHNKTAPLGLGLISRYLQKTINHDFNIKIFKDARKALKFLGSWKPDILGISQYSWNSELNLYVAELIKQNNPDCLIVAGGPNLDFETRYRKKFFKEHPLVDICVSYDGEIPFAEIVQRVISGREITDLRRVPVAGTYSFDSDNGEVIESTELPPRLNSLDIFGPLYTDGTFDEFLDDGFHPFLQTHRGCPFTCAFCHTGNKYYSRMLFLSPDIFRQDMQYLGKRFAGRHNIILHLANTNMSLFAEDFAIAKVIRETQQEYDWPRFMDVNSGKDPQKLLEMMSIVRFQPQIALQTLTSSVLENIKRKNIPFGDFVSFQHEVLKKTNETSTTELILCLPGETKESFLKTLKTLLNSGVQDIGIYSLMNLKGTLLSSEEYAARFGYQIRHRVVPRQFSLVKGKKILDTEEVIVETNTMSYQDYLELRGICFTVTTFFGSTELIPLKRLLIEYGIDIAIWVFSIHNRLYEFPDINLLFKEFVRETEEELFPTRAALVNFFEKSENFKALCTGRLGDNLLRKYKCILLSSHYKSVLELTLSEARNLLRERLGENMASDLVKDLSVYLSTRNVREIFDGSNVITDRIIHLNYDIPRWLSSVDNQILLGDFFGSYDYSVKFEKNIKKKARDFIKMNKEQDLSLQILYRDGGIRDFWPKWLTLESSSKGA